MYRLMYRGSGRRFAEITPSKKKKKTEEGENKREREKSAGEIFAGTWTERNRRTVK